IGGETASKQDMDKSAYVRHNMPHHKSRLKVTKDRLNTFGDYVSPRRNARAQKECDGMRFLIELNDDDIGVTQVEIVPKPKRSKKKRVIYDSEGLPVASHPPKRLRADYGTAGGSVTRGKSLSALNRLLQDSRLSVEQGVNLYVIIKQALILCCNYPDNEDGKETEVTKDKVQPKSSQSTANVQPR
ncbi:hypothetical protein Tco_1197153, partial [Tanacetum coccineum]